MVKKNLAQPVPLFCVAEYADAAVKILEQARTREVRLTGLKLVEALMGRGTANLKLTGWQV
jgi:hypothetical protein